ncbi:MAG TPA: alpha/beta hydrolase [Thermoanaerobaculia bacterium]|nr:alpha/beta hydrolase [Thermoanaerobaculia bacterium]
MIETVLGNTLRLIEVNGIHLRVAERGEGPLVLLLHGWPESWYSWRHQLPALAAAGYRAVAPDLRGYGGSDAPAEVEAYDVHHVCRDVTGLIDHYGEKTAVVVGHDWGAILAWQCALLEPDRISAIAPMSVPYAGRGDASLVERLAQAQGDNFFYILYFQEPGVAEAELDDDPRGILSRLYTSPDTPREAPSITDPKRNAGGWIGRLGRPTELPGWLSAEDLDYYVAELTRAGFRGGINYYRNFHRNWESTPELAEAKVEQPVLFVAGEKDGVIRGADAARLDALMRPWAPRLDRVVVVPGVGHWVQQEAVEATNAALLEFLSSLPLDRDPTDRPESADGGESPGPGPAAQERIATFGSKA